MTEEGAEGELVRRLGGGAEGAYDLGGRLLDTLVVHGGAVGGGRGGAGELGEVEAGQAQVGLGCCGVGVGEVEWGVGDEHDVGADEAMDDALAVGVLDG